MLVHTAYSANDISDESNPKMPRKWKLIRKEMPMDTKYSFKEHQDYQNNNQEYQNKINRKFSIYQNQIL